MMRRVMLILMTVLAAGPVQAAVTVEPLEYHDGQTLLQGFLASDDAIQGKRPGLLVVHEWMGLGDYTKRRARQLAELGYVALAVDMYGKGVYAKDHAEAGRLSGAFRRDRQLMWGRIQSALDALTRQPRVDAERVGAIGYCFGGAAALELARSGADVDVVVSFHGALSTTEPAKPGTIKARVLVLHGANDLYVPQEQVRAFEQEMQEAGVRSRVVQYPGAVHGFTVPEAGDDPSKGVAYHPEADRQSWDEMVRLFEEAFGKA